MEWNFYFVPDEADVPPYDPVPTTPYNVTSGRTYYYNNEASGERNMKEICDEYCIPVFGNPLSPMGRENKYSCDFLNVGSTNTSYVVLHDLHSLQSAVLLGKCLLGHLKFKQGTNSYNNNILSLWDFF